MWDDWLPRERYSSRRIWRAGTEAPSNSLLAEVPHVQAYLSSLLNPAPKSDKGLEEGIPGAPGLIPDEKVRPHLLLVLQSLLQRMLASAKQSRQCGEARDASSRWNLNMAMGQKVSLVTLHPLQLVMETAHSNLLGIPDSPFEAVNKSLLFEGPGLAVKSLSLTILDWGAAGCGKQQVYLARVTGWPAL